MFSAARSAHSMIWRCIWTTMSGTILVSTSCHFPPPSCSSTSLSILCEASVLGSFAAVVETMRRATLSVDEAILVRSRLNLLGKQSEHRY
ncbi:uncharacterized protein BCR38DRAFT_188916 [Pseudomassariella vexata]|uniref:Secreted protein n=1 Tax=Pseudomassariella vexata TaxID=1141098 RepID=A0A1Y2E0D4_9PEZI|nr:uncharacterized protein BCR38DRAFT_188916 [Pseudomassariella vexata]ORY64992.1 hypothetical protein BCR38DRAFT_188916 [Pseudomassariella vexata]